MLSDEKQFIVHHCKPIDIQNKHYFVNRANYPWSAEVYSLRRNANDHCWPQSHKTVSKLPDD